MSVYLFPNLEWPAPMSDARNGMTATVLFSSGTAKGKFESLSLSALLFKNSTVSSIAMVLCNSNSRFLSDLAIFNSICICLACLFCNRSYQERWTTEKSNTSSVCVMEPLTLLSGLALLFIIMKLPISQFTHVRFRPTFAAIVFQLMICDINVHKRRIFHIDDDQSALV